MMIQNEKQKREYYQALLLKDSAYEGVFFAGITSTGIFCRPTCTARKPKFENCLFFKEAKEAIYASFRPCLRCKPLTLPNEASEIVQSLINAVEENPEKRWKDRDFDALSIHAATARRHFKKRFGMTFVEYARARRMGIAMKEIREGESIVDTQLNVGYESGSGFRDAFSRIMGAVPTQAKNIGFLKASWLDTQLGAMLALADDEALYLLEFVDRRGLEKEVERLRDQFHFVIVPGRTAIIDQIEKELDSYFQGGSSEFKTPIKMLGSVFQQKVWCALQNIPLGQTRSYAEQAQNIGQPSAVRAVARANGANQLAIIIPCHRVIGSDGSLTGYAGGLPRKKWLLEHEAKMAILNNVD